MEPSGLTLPTRYLDAVHATALEVAVTRCDVGYSLLARMGAEHADPAGWWLAYIHVDPDQRGRHAGTALLVDTFAQVDVAPFVARKRGRPAVWSGHGRWGYEPSPAPWRFPGLTMRTHQLYVASEQDHRR